MLYQDPILGTLEVPDDAPVHEVEALLAPQRQLAQQQQGWLQQMGGMGQMMNGLFSPVQAFAAPQQEAVAVPPAPTGVQAMGMGQNYQQFEANRLEREKMSRTEALQQQQLKLQERQMVQQMIQDEKDQAQKIQLANLKMRNEQQRDALKLARDEALHEQKLELERIKGLQAQEKHEQSLFLEAEKTRNKMLVEQQKGDAAARAASIRASAARAGGAGSGLKTYFSSKDGGVITFDPSTGVAAFHDASIPRTEESKDEPYIDRANQRFYFEGQELAFPGSILPETQFELDAIQDELNILKATELQYADYEQYVESDRYNKLMARRKAALDKNARMWEEGEHPLTKIPPGGHHLLKQEGITGDVLDDVVGSVTRQMGESRLKGTGPAATSAKPAAPQLTPEQKEWQRTVQEGTDVDLANIPTSLVVVVDDIDSISADQWAEAPVGTLFYGSTPDELGEYPRRLKW